MHFFDYVIMMTYCVPVELSVTAKKTLPISGQVNSLHTTTTITGWSTDES